MIRYNGPVSRRPRASSRVSPVDHWMLAELRYHIRRFLRTREVAARAAGIEPQHYLLLLQVEPTTAGEAILERLALQDP